MSYSISEVISSHNVHVFLLSFFPLAICYDMAPVARSVLILLLTPVPLEQILRHPSRVLPSLQGCAMVVGVHLYMARVCRAPRVLYMCQALGLSPSGASVGESFGLTAHNSHHLHGSDCLGTGLRLGIVVP